MKGMKKNIKEERKKLRRKIKGCREKVKVLKRGTRGGVATEKMNDYEIIMKKVLRSKGGRGERRWIGAESGRKR